MGLPIEALCMCKIVNHSMYEDKEIYRYHLSKIIIEKVLNVWKSGFVILSDAVEF